MNKIIRGVAHRSAKLTEAQVAEVVERLAKGEKGRSIAEALGVHEAQVSRIKHGKQWSHIRRSGDGVVCSEGGDPCSPMETSGGCCKKDEPA